jgi:hypothetical protein
MTPRKALASKKPTGAYDLIENGFIALNLNNGTALTDLPAIRARVPLLTDIFTF